MIPLLYEKRSGVAPFCCKRNPSDHFSGTNFKFVLAPGALAPIANNPPLITSGQHKKAACTGPQRERAQTCMSTWINHNFHSRTEDKELLRLKLLDLRGSLKECTCYKAPVEEKRIISKKLTMRRRGYIFNACRSRRKKKFVLTT